MRRIGLPLLLLGVALVAPATAGAHISISPPGAPAGSYAHLELSIPHGCDGSPTTRIAVKIPDDVPSVIPQRSPFWQVETKEGPKQAEGQHGEKSAQGVTEVVWTAREPLPDHELDVLGMTVALPDAAGETLWFPVIQTCAKGQNRWIQIPAEGEDAHDLSDPAPGIELTAAKGHGHEAGAHEDRDQEGSADDDEDSGSTSGLSVAALVLGALALLVSGTGLLRSGRH